MTQGIQRFNKRYVNVLGVLIGLTVVSSILFYTGCGMTSSPNIRTNPTPTPDTTPPTVTSLFPAPGANDVNPSANMIVTFSENMDPATVNVDTIQLIATTLPTPALVPATVSYDAITKSATLNPNADLSPGAPYTLVVRGGATGPRVKDLAGNAMITDEGPNFRTAPDTTPPTSTITSPAAGVIVPFGIAFNITGTASDTGGGSVAKVEVSVDGGATWNVATGTSAWSYSWTPTTIGSVTIKSRAIDTSGNVQDPPAGVIVTVQDRTPPTSKITFPTSGEIVSTGTVVTITGTASDASPGSVAVVEISFDGGVAWIQATGTSAWSFNWTPTLSGQTTIKSRAIDTSRNFQNPPAEVTVTVQDATPPTSRITSQKGGAPGITVNITGTASDAGGGTVARVDVSVDGGATYNTATGTTAWSYTWTTPTTPGLVTIRSRAIDDSGNVQDPPAEITFTVRFPVTIHVPSEQPTIQSAINVSDYGDTVLVAPGTYRENINFGGKAITVTSERGPEDTFIDGSDAGSVVSFISGEGRDSTLNGFTLQNGSVDQVVGEGGGIIIRGSSPRITNNVINNNQACDGGGIGIAVGSPLIQLNTITGNRAGTNLCSGGTVGGGILISGADNAEILDNVISGNFGAFGGGIGLFVAGTPIIKRNIIKGNFASQGGGGWTVGDSNPLIVQNLITGNQADDGGGLYWAVPPAGVRGPILVNNTIADNNATSNGSGIFAFGYDAQTELTNNLIVAKPGQSALYFLTFSGQNSPIIRFNNIFSAGGKAYDGAIPDMTGTNSNISADPLFVNPTEGDYHLQQGSPSIDSGYNQAPNLPDKDIDGDPRILDGDGNGIETIDMGVDEFLLPPGLKISLLDESNRNSTNGLYPFICDLRPWTRTLSRRPKNRLSAPPPRLRVE